MADDAAAAAVPRRARLAVLGLAGGFLLLAIAVLDWWLLKTGAVSHDARWLTAWIWAAGALFALRAGAVLVGVCRRRRPWASGAAEIVAIGGLGVVLAAGSANWLLRLQGFVVLYEGEERPLFGGAHLEGFDAGPLADPRELGLEIALAKVELVPGGEGTFSPVSRLVVRDAGGERQALSIDPKSAAAVGPLRFHQGAFGFAPKIVLQKDGKVFFDETVPFVTERVAGRGVSFQGEFTVESEDVAVAGTVSLDSLDEAMRGHPTLELEVRRAGEPLGAGPLQVGHFAELSRGYRVGFAGLKYWSEIDVSRRNYSAWMRGGGWALLAGLAAWPLARLRERR